MAEEHQAAGAEQPGHAGRHSDESARGEGGRLGSVPAFTLPRFRKSQVLRAGDLNLLSDFTRALFDTLLPSSPVSAGVLRGLWPEVSSEAGNVTLEVSPGLSVSDQGDWIFVPRPMRLALPDQAPPARRAVLVLSWIEESLSEDVSEEIETASEYLEHRVNVSLRERDRAGDGGAVEIARVRFAPGARLQDLRSTAAPGTEKLLAPEANTLDLRQVRWLDSAARGFLRPELQQAVAKRIGEALAEVEDPPLTLRHTALAARIAAATGQLSRSLYVDYLKALGGRLTRPARGFGSLTATELLELRIDGSGPSKGGDDEGIIELHLYESDPRAEVPLRNLRGNRLEVSLWHDQSSRRFKLSGYLGRNQDFVWRVEQGPGDGPWLHTWDGKPQQRFATYAGWSPSSLDFWLREEHGDRLIAQCRFFRESGRLGLELVFHDPGQWPRA